MNTSIHCHHVRIVGFRDMSRLWIFLPHLVGVPEFWNPSCHEFKQGENNFLSSDSLASPPSIWFVLWPNMLVSRSILVPCIQASKKMSLRDMSKEPRSRISLSFHDVICLTSHRPYPFRTEHCRSFEIPPDIAKLEWILSRPASLWITIEPFVVQHIWDVPTLFFLFWAILSFSYVEENFVFQWRMTSSSISRGPVRTWDKWMNWWCETFGQQEGRRQGQLFQSPEVNYKFLWSHTCSSTSFVWNPVPWMCPNWVEVFVWNALEVTLRSLVDSYCFSFYCFWVVGKWKDILDFHWKTVLKSKNSQPSAEFRWKWKVTVHLSVFPIQFK